jgi:DNA ligase (NAD+)
MNRKRIGEIIKILENANDEYYNKANSIITDQEYDKLKDELKSLCPTHPFLSQVGQRITVSDWKKAKHKIAMGSLNKVNTIDEFKKWGLEIGGKYYVVEDKLDGGSLDLEYDVGKLTKGITRGDGIEGDDITSNVVKMQNVRKDMNGFTGSLRGEIFLCAKDFAKINKILVAEGTKPLSNPRNGAVGICKRFDGRFSEYLTVLYYDIEGIDVKTEFEKMEFIKDVFRLDVAFYKRVTLDEAIKLYEAYEEKLRAETPYDIDGLVIKADEIALQDKHGLLGGRPKAQIAWKFTSMKVETELEEVVWQVGGMRRISPVAQVKPVNIGGVVVRRASLHNIDNFKNLKLGKGDKVIISRRNDVIPYLEEIVESKGYYFKAPTHCPVCRAEVEIDGKYLICPNDDCKALALGNLEKWIRGLDIMDIGESIIEALHRAGKVNEPADFYKLSVSDIANLEGLGEKSAKKILEHLHQKKELTLPEFIGNLNMYQFSTSRVETLVDASFDTVDKLLNAKINDLNGISGIGLSTAEKIVNGLKSKKTVIKNLLDIGITIKAIQKAQVRSNKLKGQSFCFTGGINRVDRNGDRYTRDMMEALVIENGGQIDSVKKGLSHLVQADPSSTSSKSQKAKELGVDILSEADFFKMLGI